MNYDPHVNPKVISVIEQDDGNWIAEAQRFGRVIRVRGSNPLSVVQGIITSDGKQDIKTV